MGGWTSKSSWREYPALLPWYPWGERSCTSQVTLLSLGEFSKYKWVTFLHPPVSSLFCDYTGRGSSNPGFWSLVHVLQPHLAACQFSAALCFYCDHQTSTQSSKQLLWAYLLEPIIMSLGWMRKYPLPDLGAQFFVPFTILVTQRIWLIHQSLEHKWYTISNKTNVLGIITFSHWFQVGVGFCLCEANTDFWLLAVP